MNVSADLVLQDELAMKVAGVLVIANQTASGHGIDLSRCLVTVAQESPPMEHLWRVHYGARDAMNHRSGDLDVLINARDGDVQRAVFGQ